MEYVVFVWSIAAFTSILCAFLKTLFVRLPLLRVFRGYNSGLLVLGLLLWVPKLSGSGSFPFIEVWMLVLFFQSLWPAFFAALFGIALEEGVMGTYRFMKRFHHTKIIFMCLLLAFYIPLSVYNLVPSVQNILLNVVIYTAIWYWRFGFQTLVYHLKKMRIPFFYGALLLIGATIASGEMFIVPLLLVMGLGISDIWMDYHHRGAEKLLFTTQLK